MVAEVATNIRERLFRSLKQCDNNLPCPMPDIEAFRKRAFSGRGRRSDWQLRASTTGDDVLLSSALCSVYREFSSMFVQTSCRALDEAECVSQPLAAINSFGVAKHT